MHVAAASPQFLKVEDVCKDAEEKERAIFLAQAAESGKKPEHMQKMVYYTQTDTRTHARTHTHDGVLRARAHTHTRAYMYTECGMRKMVPDVCALSPFYPF